MLQVLTYEYEATLYPLSASLSFSFTLKDGRPLISNTAAFDSQGTISNYR
jgi:hypothetical protein